MAAPHPAWLLSTACADAGTILESFAWYQWLLALKVGLTTSLCMQSDETDWGRCRTMFTLHSEQTTIKTHWNKNQVRSGNKSHLKLGGK